MDRSGLLDNMVGRVVTVHTDREGIPAFGILAGYDEQGVMLHIPSELAEKLAEKLGTEGASTVSSQIFIPWRIVEYVATDVEDPA